MTIHENFSLQEYNTFKINVSAKYFVEVQSIDDIYEALTKFQDEKFLILGAGANILFTEDFDGVILFNKFRGIKVLEESQEHIFYEVASGENWHEFVMNAVGHNYGGIENLALIPGTVGASAIQNVGAYGAQVSDVIESVRYLDLLDLTEKKLSNAECQFTYRDSIFKHELIGKTFITSVTFKLSLNPVLNTEFGNTYGGIIDEIEGEDLTVGAVAKAVIKLRTKKLADPTSFPNAGSFFKNPIVSREKYEELAVDNLSNPNFAHYDQPDGNVKLSAGWAIEYAGLKGLRHNTAGVYDKHALVLVNYEPENPDAGKNLKELEEIIIAKVFERWGITLENEVIII